MRGGPPTFGFGAAALLGTDARVVGAGAEPSVRPGPSKLSLDCLPQRLPMCNVDMVVLLGGGMQKAARRQLEGGGLLGRVVVYQMWLCY